MSIDLFLCKTESGRAMRYHITWGVVRKINIKRIKIN